jgi:hypothetical protein
MQMSLFAQIDEPAFFSKINNMYYALELTDLNNFSSWITSNVFEDATKGFYDNEVFPLEVIWIKPNDLYFIQRPLPVIDDSTLSKKAKIAQSDMQKEIRALLIDWSRFYSGRLLAMMPADYMIDTVSDTVILRYHNYDDPNKSKTEIYFAQNGIVLETRAISTDSSGVIYTYPEYKFSGEYWLCTGWRVQIVRNGEVQSGFQIKLISQRLEKYWLPAKLEMTLQTIDLQDKIFVREYNFRNSRINRDIQILNK